MAKGLLVIISSPSGGGKDSVIRDLLKLFPRSTRLVTTTSRPLRPGNVDGIDYHFVSKEEFEQKIKNRDFLEYNVYAENYYGTERLKLEKILTEYDVVFSQIEINGKHNLDKAGVKNLSIFLLPESLDILKRRIEKRGGLTPEIIAERLETAKKEIAESTDYDYRIVNKDGELEETVKNTAEIVKNRLNELSSPLS